MNPRLLEDRLRDLARVGTRVARSADFDMWTFEFDGKTYELHFYPRAKRGKVSALREFTNLQRLQKAGIPSPRASAHLSGFRLDDRLGDAVLLEHVPAKPLGDWLAKERAEFGPFFGRTQFLNQLIEILRQIGLAKFGHRTLVLNSFGIVDGKLVFIDAARLATGGLRTRDLMHLAHDAKPFLTRGDIFRAWDIVGQGAPLPRKNLAAAAVERAAEKDAICDGETVGRIAFGDWNGLYTRHISRPRFWSSASRLTFTDADWQPVLAEIFRRLDAKDGDVLKSDDSGDVIAFDLALAGATIPVVVKRPRRNKLLRYVTDIGRPSRVRRTWLKAWKLLARDFPVEFPLLMIERRIFGYVVDLLIVFEKVPGQTLAKIDLDALTRCNRDALFFGVGRILRRIEAEGFTHFDAKSSNWIIHMTPDGPMPVLLDLDGIRHYRWSMAGIDRLLRAMRSHPQYAPDDSFHLCRGYAPRAKLVREPETGNRTDA